MPRPLDAPPETPAPRRSDSVAIVEAIVGAARELIAHGMDGFTMDGVAKRAGVGPASLYRYFPDKAALVTEVFRVQHVAVMEEMGNALALGRTLDEKVRVCVAGYIRWDEEEAQLRRVLNFEIPPAWTLEGRAEATRQLHARFSAEGARHLVEVPVEVVENRLFHALSVMLGSGQLRLIVPELAPRDDNLEATLGDIVMSILKPA